MSATCWYSGKQNIDRPCFKFQSCMCKMLFYFEVESEVVNKIEKALVIQGRNLPCDAQFLISHTYDYWSTLEKILPFSAPPMVAISVTITLNKCSLIKHFH